jgi:hypothetical protein
VALVQGDVFLPHLSASPWNFSEVIECQLASRTSIPPDGRGDLLLCGEKTQLAWSQALLRPDIKTQIYAASERLAVEFHSVGHPLLGNRSKPRSWQVLVPFRVNGTSVNGLRLFAYINSYCLRFSRR